ncbi:MAG: hypothetical protein ACERLM_16010 [Acidimicrobiales bacterium]|jgi:hypothetical protein
MSADHKTAIAEGRTQSRAIGAYLDAIESARPKRGRKRTPESIGTRLERIEAEIGEASPTKRVELIQERIDLNNELAALAEVPDLSAVTAGFVAHAKAYSDRKGISYAAWREMGVDGSTLKEAGISRSG